MIDRAARWRRRADQLEDEAVHLVEDRRVFHPQRGELVDVEEAAVVDFLGRDAPVRQAVRLLVQQPIERVEAARLAGDAVEPRDRARRRARATSALRSVERGRAAA